MSKAHGGAKKGVCSTRWGSVAIPSLDGYGIAERSMGYRKLTHYIKMLRRRYGCVV